MADNNSLKKYAPLVIRVGLAAVFIVYGWGKLADMSTTVQNFSNMGIPAAGVMAWIVAIIEFVGGLLLLIGWYTRWAAAAIAVVMAGAMITVKFSKGFVGGWDFDLVLFLMAISLLFSGSGAPAVDDVQSIDQTADESQ